MNLRMRQANYIPRYKCYIHLFLTNYVIKCKYYCNIRNTTKILGYILYFEIFASHKLRCLFCIHCVNNLRHLNVYSLFTRRYNQ